MYTQKSIQKSEQSQIKTDTSELLLLNLCVFLLPRLGNVRNRILRPLK